MQSGQSEPIAERLGRDYLAQRARRVDAGYRHAGRASVPDRHSHGPLPKLGPVPTGTWTGIHWIAVPVGHAPAVSAITDLDSDPNATIEGWSKGYVEFVWDPHTRNLVPWTSTDGLHWDKSTKLDTTAWAADMRDYDSDNDASEHDKCAFVADNFQEGPATILLDGYVHCDTGCGSDPFDTSDGTWTSSNGRVWSPVKIPDAIDGGISGGSAGFIALGGTGNEGYEQDDMWRRNAVGSTVWVSPNARTWTQGALPMDVMTAGSEINDPVSFAGGFVLPGEVAVKNGTHTVGFTGCAGQEPPRDYITYQPALWWSPDGKTWTRDTIGAPAYQGFVTMTLYSVDDHMLVAQEERAAPGYTHTVDLYWASTDGKTWTRITSTVGDDVASGTIIGRDHGLIITGNWYGSCTTLGYSSGPTTLCTPEVANFGANDKLVALKRSGDGFSLVLDPAVDGWLQMALGPAGLLVTYNGTRFWMGVPTAT